MRLFKMGFFVVLVISFVLMVDQEGVRAEGHGLFDVGSFIDELMVVEFEEEHIPNAVVTVVYDGEVIFSKGYGFANLENGDPVDPNTSLFRIGSITKLFTWTAIMQLVEQDKLDLDTDINEYVDFDIPVGPYHSDPITLRHLLTHTPGFEDYSDTIFRLKEAEMLPLAEYVREYMPERVFPAGEVAAYSNYGTTLAGYIVEQVSGLDYSDYIAQHILEPLQMENSTLKQPLPKSISNNMTQAYRYVKGEFLEGHFEYVPTPAGAMSSSAMDMAKFMIAMLENDERILQTETFVEMKQQQFTQHPYLDGMTLGYIERTMNDKRLLVHGGSTMIYDSGVYLLPEERFGIFISYSGGNYTTHTKIINEVMDHYFPAPRKDDIVPPRGMKERSRQYVGEYHQNRRSFTTSEKFISLINGTMRVEVDDDGYLLVTYMGYTNPFVEKEEGVYQSLHQVEQLYPYGMLSTIAFEKDRNGVVRLMTDGPMSYSKASWYETSGFTFLSLIMSILIIIGSVILWAISWVIRHIKGRGKMQQSTLSIWAKWVAVMYGVCTLLVLIGFSLNGEMSPIYGLPKTAYTIAPAWMKMFALIPYLLVLFSCMLVVLVVLNWWRMTGKLSTRIHYTVFTCATIVLSWLFYYWNIV